MKFYNTNYYFGFYSKSGISLNVGYSFGTDFFEHGLHKTYVKKLIKEISYEDPQVLMLQKL